MNYDEIVAGLIQQSLEATSVGSHERVLLRGYSTDQARPIVERLLSGSVDATVGLPEDDGSITEVALPAARWSTGHQTIELLPFVVAENPVASDPPWVGSQGFASRLRTSFHHSVAPGVIRVLVLFDARPVETEQTTASESLAVAMDSVEALIAWFDSPSWRSGFATAVYDTAVQVVEWWRDWVRGNPRWNILPHHKQLEQAATFMQACRPCSSASDVGQRLPHLGLLFKDPDFLSDRKLDRRLEKNAELGSRLDGIRLQRTLDPLLEADQVVDLGPPGEAFHDRLAEGLRDPDLQITQRDLTYTEINERLRSRERYPAWLDVAGIDVVALDSDGSPEGESLPWRLLDDVDAPPDGDGSAEVVIPCPTSAVRITIPVEGDLRSFVYRDGSFVADAGVDQGGLRPGTQLVLDFDRPDPFSVTEFLVREKRPGRGRPPRPTQVVRVGVVAGDRVAVPEASTLDPEARAFVVDGAADSLRVQVGGAELRVTEGLPPEDGTAVEAEIDGVEFRWIGEDRSPTVDHDPAPRAHLRLLELIGVRQTGDPGDFQPYFLESGELGATCRTSGSLDVPAAWMEEEAALLLDPQQFFGIDGDLDAATSEIRAVAAGAFDAWMHARIAFFEAAREQCERLLPGIGGQRPSMYLVDLREEELSALAREYTQTYAVLVETTSQGAQATANRAVIEPVLLCDRAPSADDAIRIAPTHPSAVALLASIQRGLLSGRWADTEDRDGLDELLQRPLLGGLLPWLPWRGQTLDALQSTPLLWRCYGTEGGTLDTSDELGPVVVQKVKRLLNLAPHLNSSGQRVYINIEIGQGSGDYLVQALLGLERDKSVKCCFDVGVVCSDEQEDPDLIRVFASGPSGEGASFRDRLHGFVRVCRIDRVSARHAHLVFRMEAAQSDLQPFASMAESHPLVRDTGFAGGLSHEPARFAVSTPNEVVYTRYVSADEVDDAVEPPAEDGSWDGEWRRLYQQICRVTRHTAVGLQSEVGEDSLPCQTLRQIAGGEATEQYDSSFITVHCDPAQGPEFFVGARTTRSGVFLVECSDRGSPELPGRDIVSVTSRIGPFRAALATAVSTLPEPLHELVNDEVARGLLRDINILRGTEVFDFLREISRETSHIYFMDGLDNVLALRFLLSQQGAVDGHLPVVVALRDLTARCKQLAALRRGTKCDDIVVFYLPRFSESNPVLHYRLVEVKFGPRQQQWSKAQRQLSETGQKLSSKLPTGQWRDERSPLALLLQRDLAWTIHEALERYRAFGLLPSDPEMEATWGLRGLFRCLQRGEFELRPFAAGSAADPQLVNGTAMMLDPTIPGAALDDTVEQATEYLTVPRDVIAELLVAAVPAVSGASGEPPGVPQPASPPATSAPVAPPSGVMGGAEDDPEQMETSAQEGDGPFDESETAPADGADSGAGISPPGAESVAGPGGNSADVAQEAESPAAPVEAATAPTSPRVQSRREQVQAGVDSVFDGFVGNTGPVNRLKRAIMIATLEGKQYLESVGLYGPKSTGKTELAKRISQALNLPRLELSETLIRSADDLAAKIQETADAAGTPMRMEADDHGGTILRAPPMVVFIDEVHLLRPRVQESLLKALEPDDRTLLSTIGTVDTSQVTFIIATTDPGDLGDAFKSRVARFELREYTVDELVDILDAHRLRRSDIPPEARSFDRGCLEVFALVGRQVPRQALRHMRDAAREVGVGLLEPERDALRTYFWDNYRADDRGLTDRDRRYLRLLFPDHVVGLDALAAQLGEGRSTISADLEPYLLRLGLIQRGRGGRFLTRRGRELVPSLQD